MNGKDREGDADVGDGTHVGRHGSAGGDERDVDDLYGGANDDAGLDVTQDQSHDQTAHQGAPKRVVTDGRAAHAGQRRQAGTQSKQRGLQIVNLHKL